jgi:creatinine amidohydrolase
VTETRWNRLTAPELVDLAARDALVLVPVGATEQHGGHLPTGVDDFLAAEVSRRAAELVAPSAPVIVTPSVWCGLSEQHMPFGGTITIRVNTLRLILRDVCRSLVRCGFRRILIVNGHRGAVAALDAIVDDLTPDLDADLAVTSYYVAGHEAVAEALTGQDRLMHGCEAETSMALAAFPELVRTDRIEDAFGPDLPAGPGCAARPEPVYRSVPFGMVTSSGVAGDARGADADKGERILDGCARALAALISAETALSAD